MMLARLLSALRDYVVGSSASRERNRFGETPEAFAAGLLAANPEGLASDLLSGPEQELATAAVKAGGLAFISGGFGATDYYVPASKD